MKLVITGAPRTKKNHGYVARLPNGRRIHMPSKAWTKWCTGALVWTGDRVWHGFGGKPLFPDEALNCAAVYYRDCRRGDPVGYNQGLADLLEKRRVVANDQQIVTWDGSRMDIDPKNPRVELELEVVSG